MKSETLRKEVEMDHPTYSIFYKGWKRDWLKKQIDLARVCADEVPLEKAQYVFVSAQSIGKLPKQGLITAIILSEHELTLAEQSAMQTAVREGRVQIATSILDKNLATKLTRMFPPITSCHDIPKTIAA
jgi:hypothetical protein